METGDTFDRYVVEARIGQGGMGEVFRVYDPKLHRKVALKVLHLEGSGDRAQAERILREARAAAALDHPCAVHIYDVGEHDGRPYMAMELIEGKSLRVLVGDPTIALETKLRWICDVGRALASAHKRGLVHRDVKPENVMVRDDGAIKVLDFGIARRAQAPIDPTAPTAVGAPGTMTGDGMIVGTPLYMPPEQMRGEPVDSRTDQFAWGVLAYELLSGHLPWGPATDGVRLIATMLSQDPPLLRAVVPSLPERVESAIARALSRKRDDRFASMTEAIAALDHGESASRGARTSDSTRLGDLAHAATEVAPARTDETGKRDDRRVAMTVRTTSRRPLAVGLAIVAVAAASLLTWRWRMQRNVGGEPAASTSASNATKTSPVAITDLPTPKTAVPGAASAYREGLQALRDGSWELARRAFQRASELDPSMPEAHLRYAIVSFGEFHRDEAHKSWQRVLLLRGTLGERDAALFDAYDVVVPRDVADWVELQRRTAAMVKRWPDDAELHMLLADAWVRVDHGGDAIAEYDRAIALDPLYADAWTGRAGALQALGRFDEMLESQKQCEQRFPTSTDCVWTRVWLHHWRGPCGAMESATRRYLERDPASATAWTMKAQALYSLGRSLESVRDAFDHAAAIFPESERPLHRKLWELDLLAAEGDFVAVEKLALEIEPLIAGDANERWHLAVARARIGAFLEQGRADDAAKVADDYLKRADNWSASQELLAEYSPRFSMNAVLFHAGKLDAKSFEGMRVGFLYQLSTGSPPLPQGYRWVAGFADAVEDAAEAKRALGSLSEYAPLPQNESVHAPTIGRVLALAGQWDDALPHLELTEDACFSMEAPREVRRNSYFLGLAREAKGDVPGACRAYAALLSHWGKAKPKSVTADLAKARVTALKCGT